MLNGTLDQIQIKNRYDSTLDCCTTIHSYTSEFPINFPLKVPNQKLENKKLTSASCWTPWMFKLCWDAVSVCKCPEQQISSVRHGGGSLARLTVSARDIYWCFLLLRVQIQPNKSKSPGKGFIVEQNKDPMECSWLAESITWSSPGRAASRLKAERQHNNTDLRATAYKAPAETSQRISHYVLLTYH